MRFVVFLGLAAARHRPIFALPQEMVSTSAAAAEAARAADAAADNTVATVVQLLNEMLTTSKEDAVSERELYAKFKCFCASTVETKAASIANLTANIDQMTTDIADMESRIAELSDEVSGLLADMTANADAREQALVERNKENADFLLSEADMATGIGAVSQAVTLLRAVTPESFLQRGRAAAGAAAGAAARLQLEQAAVKTAAVYGDASLRRAAEQWLAGDQRDGEIVGVLASLNDTLTVNLDNCRQAELNSETDFNRTTAVALAEWTTMNETASTKAAEVASTQQARTSTARAKRTAERQKAADEAFLAATTKRCSQKGKEYTHRQALRAQEEQAIAQAIAILDSDDSFASFDKVGKRVFAQGVTFIQVGQDAQRAQRALAQLEHAAAGMSTAGAKQRLGRVCAALTGPTAFDEVLALIARQITAIDDEQAMDDHKLQWCSDEQTASEDNRDSKNTAITGIETNQATLTGSIATAKDNLNTTEIALVLNRKTQKEETEDRQAENKAYRQSYQDMADAEAILKKAISVLTKFYEYLRAHEGAHSYTESAGKDTPPTWNLRRLAGKTVEELEAACSLEPLCLGFSEDGWLKAQTEPSDELFDSGTNLHVKTFDEDALPSSFVQLREEPAETGQQALRSGGSTAVDGESATWDSAMDGQKAEGGEAVEMLQYILTETETERNQATTDENTAQGDYDTEMATLKGQETQLLTDHDTYSTELATAEQGLEEANEDHRATTRERDAIEAFITEIEPGCTFMQDNHATRTSNRAAEKAALEGAITTLQGTPAFQAANATYVSPLA